MESFSEYNKRIESIKQNILRNSFGISRGDMPQVNSKIQKTYLDWLNSQDVSYRKSTEKVSNLKATQGELDWKKVVDIANNTKTGINKDRFKPVIVSSDRYVLDGHHRWAGTYMMDPNYQVDVWKIDLPIAKLIQLTREWPGVTKKELHESTISLYHGTSGHFTKFSQASARSANDLWGGGVGYFTDDEGIAQSYARAANKRVKKGETVMKVDLSVSNPFDVTKEYSGQDTLTYFNKSGMKAEDFLRFAGKMGLGADKYVLSAKLKAGELAMTGGEIFKGISKNQMAGAAARDLLIKMGHDSLIYSGGDNMGGKKHKVYIAYDPNKITITSSPTVSGKG